MNMQSRNSGGGNLKHLHFKEEIAIRVHKHTHLHFKYWRKDFSASKKKLCSISRKTVSAVLLANAVVSTRFWAANFNTQTVPSQLHHRTAFNRPFTWWQLSCQFANSAGHISQSQSGWSHVQFSHFFPLLYLSSLCLDKKMPHDVLCNTPTTSVSAVSVAAFALNLPLQLHAAQCMSVHVCAWVRPCGTVKKM